VQCWVGGEPLLESVFRYTYPDPWQMSYGTYSREEGRNDFGIEFDAVSLAPNVRAQEWFIPWDALGHDAEPVVGQRLGFSPGYNDMDPSQHDGLKDSDGNIMHDKLRFKDRRGPWAHPSNKGPNPDPWGALEMGRVL
jgi:hypothetical protein